MFQAPDGPRGIFCRTVHRIPRPGNQNAAAVIHQLDTAIGATLPDQVALRGFQSSWPAIDALNNLLGVLEGQGVPYSQILQFSNPTLLKLDYKMNSSFKSEETGDDFSFPVMLNIARSNQEANRSDVMLELILGKDGDSSPFHLTIAMQATF